MGDPATQRRRYEAFERKLDVMASVINDLKDELATMTADLPAISQPSPDEAPLPVEAASPHRRVRRSRLIYSSGRPRPPRATSEPVLRIENVVAYVMSQDGVVELFFENIEKAIAYTAVVVTQVVDSEDLASLDMIRVCLSEMHSEPWRASLQYAIDALLELQRFLDKNGPFATPFEDYPKHIFDVVSLACSRGIDPYDKFAFKEVVERAFGDMIGNIMKSKIHNARWQVFERILRPPPVSLEPLL